MAGVDAPPTPRSWPRRSLGLALCLSPVALPLVSLILGLTALDEAAFAGVGFALPALAIGLLNLYLSVARPVRHRRTQDPAASDSQISGMPLIGTVLVLLAAIVGFGAVGTAALCLLAMLLDTGGSAWLLIATWHDDSLWDA